jgi:hypothetical protein
MMAAMALVVGAGATVYAERQLKYPIHDVKRPAPPLVTPGAEAGQPPSDAVVLFDGKSTDQWVSDKDGGPPKWVVDPNDHALICTPGSGYVRTKQSFGDCQLHVEWSEPTPPHGNSQGRGNSGVFLQGLYEVQVLDNYKNPTYPDGQCGAVYGQNPPMANACRPPGQWQSYDIIFRRPHFSKDGKLISPAYVTVIQNGVVVQDHFEIWGATGYHVDAHYTAGPDKLPLKLQDHHNPVRYRNIWIRPLPPAIAP